MMIELNSFIKKNWKKILITFSIFLIIPFVVKFKHPQLLMTFIVIISVLLFCKLNASVLINGSKGLYSLKTIMTPEKIAVPVGINFLKIKNTNTIVNIPSKGDRCFDCELPCSPRENVHLTKRTNTISDGFKVIRE